MHVNMHATVTSCRWPALCVGRPVWLSWEGKKPSSLGKRGNQQEALTTVITHLPYSDVKFLFCLATVIRNWQAIMETRFLCSAVIGAFDRPYGCRAGSRRVVCRSHAAQGM